MRAVYKDVVCVLSSTFNQHKQIRALLITNPTINYDNVYAAGLLIVGILVRH